ncbi:MAG: hypothetical protein GY809_16310, partial [Planctomycetes bacterium]|nr:hypothetical protein [Planctomycetota bacterium]
MANVTPFDTRRYDMPVGKPVTLGPGAASNVAFVLKSKQAYYGRVLFDDGSPAILSPSESPLPVGHREICIFVKDSYSVSVAEVDDESYFKIHLDESALDALKSRGHPMEIGAPSTPVKGFEPRGLGVYPFERLSRNRATAGEARIFNPQKRLTPEDIFRKLPHQTGRLEDMLLDFD